MEENYEISDQIETPQKETIGKAKEKMERWSENVYSLYQYAKKKKDKFRSRRLPNQLQLSETINPQTHQHSS
jgi:hypothetical protein